MTSLTIQHLPAAADQAADADGDRARAEAFLATVRLFAGERLAPLAATIDRDDEIGDKLFGELAGAGLFANSLLYQRDQPHGGTERVRFLLRVLEELARVSPPVAKAVMDQNLGQIGMLREYADDALRDACLDRIGSGAVQAAFAMSEPQTGSQVSRFQTVATRVPGGFRISGEKDWITGAARRQLHFVVAKPAPDAREVGLFTVDRTLLGPGDGTVEIDDRKEKLGLRGLGEYHVRYNDVFVPDARVVLGFDRGSLRRIMRHYNGKRLGQAAICIGLSKSALRTAFDYAGRRLPAGSPAYVNMQTTLAPLVSELKAAEAMTAWAAAEWAGGDETGAPSAMAKYVVGELALRITNASAQVCGANGLSDKLPIIRLMRDARMLTMAGGASEVLRGTVAAQLDRLLD
ncbi:acyl-CoA dehydrogenase family protein [Kitasatospora mediocidica]|uniref:acyl-CoA dehydrogenase family protein n=1 Tax=Kitasatospora mediocidica TaxID=58352 RepID=UPI00055E652D|nr:acyl-CoA dehydrogenase family protein [Kitasatospora mediocidica]